MIATLPGCREVFPPSARFCRSQTEFARNRGVRTGKERVQTAAEPMTFPWKTITIVRNDHDHQNDHPRPTSTKVTPDKTSMYGDDRLMDIQSVSISRGMYIQFLVNYPITTDRSSFLSPRTQDEVVPVLPGSDLDSAGVSPGRPKQRAASPAGCIIPEPEAWWICHSGSGLLPDP
jgi:hypothetical protein